MEKKSPKKDSWKKPPGKSSQVEIQWKKVHWKKNRDKRSLKKLHEKKNLGEKFQKKFPYQTSNCVRTFDDFFAQGALFLGPFFPRFFDIFFSRDFCPRFLHFILK